MFIKQTTEPRFDMDTIKRGTIIWAQHRSWKEPEMGFVVSATPWEITVCYPPTVHNVTNHFFLPVDEVADGQWDIRYSNDLVTIGSYPETDDESQ